MNNKRLAEDILKFIGSRGNVRTVTACQTRLRFSLYDYSKIDREKLNNLEEVLGVNETETQFQVIIGPNVAKVLNEIENIMNNMKNNSDSIDKGDEKRGTPSENSTENFFRRGARFLLEYLSTSFSPILISILGSGVIKGIDLLFTTSLNLYSPESGIGQIMNLIGDIPFFFLPFLIAYGAAVKLNTNVPMALSLAGAYMYPSIADSAANEEIWSLLGFEIPLLEYNGTVLPILFSVLLLSFLYKRVEKIIPGSVRLIFLPIILLLIIVPIQLVILGPAGYYLSGYVASGLKWLFSLNSWIGGFIYGALRQLLVMTGLHLSLTPVILENIRISGGDYLLPVHAISAMAVAGTALGIYFKTKDAKIKTASIATFIPGLLGVTEPGIFGLAIRFIKPWIPIALGGGLGSAFVSGMGAEAVSFSFPSILSFAIFAEHLNIMIIGWLIAFVSSFIISYLIGISESS